MTGNQKKHADTSTQDKMRTCLFGCKNVQHARHAPPNECSGKIRASNKPGIRVEDA